MWWNSIYCWREHRALFCEMAGRRGIDILCKRSDLTYFHTIGAGQFYAMCLQHIQLIDDEQQRAGVNRREFTSIIFIIKIIRFTPAW